MPTLTFTQEYDLVDTKFRICPGIAMADITIPKGSLIEAERAELGKCSYPAPSLWVKVAEKRSEAIHIDVTKDELQYAQEICHTPREMLIDLRWHEKGGVESSDMLKRTEPITMTISED